MGEDALLYKRYRIMKEMGWTYQQYRQTPVSVIDQVWAFMNTESKVLTDKAGSNNG